MHNQSYPYLYQCPLMNKSRLQPTPYQHTQKKSLRIHHSVPVVIKLSQVYHGRKVHDKTTMKNHPSWSQITTVDRQLGIIPINIIQAIPNTVITQTITEVPATTGVGHIIIAIVQTDCQVTQTNEKPTDVGINTNLSRMLNNCKLKCLLYLLRNFIILQTCLSAIPLYKWCID